MKYVFNEADHVHTLDGAPLMGTSTVVKEVMPPFLAKWGAQCAVDYLEQTKKTTVGKDGYWWENENAFKDAVNAWSKVRGEKAEAGTDMHALLEAYVTACVAVDGKPLPSADEHSAQVKTFAEWSQQYVERFIFTEKNTYSKELWVGGIVDCVALLKSGLVVVIDFKSSKEAYFNQFVQCAGYATQLDETGYGDADGSHWEKLFKPVGGLVIVPFGAKTLKPVLIENVEGYKGVFAQCVGIYTYQKSFKENGGTILVN